MDDFGCAIQAIVLIVMVVTVIFMVGMDSGETNTNEQIKYVIKAHGQTTQTLTRGLNMIMDGKDPAEMDATIKRYQGEGEE